MEIDITPIGDIESTVLQEVSAVLRDQYEATVNRTTQIPYERLDIDPQAAPYDAEQFSLTDLHRPTAAATVFITRLLVTYDNREFVFGVANTDESVCLVSTYMLYNSVGSDTNEYATPATALDRVRTEVAHEIGHVFGQSHCDTADCVMNFSMGLDGIDNKSESMCAECTSSLTVVTNPSI